MMKSLLRSLRLAALAVFALARFANAGETTVAVAANFTAPAKEIVQAFEAKTGHRVVLSFGSTGQFYAQIKQEAPFSILLAADAETPAKLVDEGLVVAGTSFTYAIGRLVLWGKNPAVPVGEGVLTSGGFEKLAVANPKLAPYGAAAIETLKTLGLYDALAPKLVQGANIAQTFQFVDTGNAELGFVALSQVVSKADAQYWLVPESLHAPIRQDAVLLEKWAVDPVARGFIEFLKGPEALKVIERYGYATVPPG